MPPTVLICPKVLDHKPGDHFDSLVGAGFAVRYAKPIRDLHTTAELMDNLKGVSAVIAGSEPYTPEIFERFPDLRVVARVGVGFDSVDVEAATRANVAVTITPGANHDSVAELTFAFMLAIAKRLVISDARVKAGEWDRKTTRPLRGQTLGIIGCGRIGQAVAARARAFGMNVIGYDPLCTLGEGCENVSLDILLSRADTISLHAPLTPETRRLVRKETIQKMKHGVVIINTARGALVDESALAEGLTKGHVAAAGLDVFENEPPVGSPILNAPNVVLAPHVGGIDDEGIRQMALMACRTVAELFQGNWPKERIVNAEALGSWSWNRSPSSEGMATADHKSEVLS